ncbi:membrane protein [Corynebacterium phocae]|uniref:Membrane protein n=1 Tax=Corynebacterium phocae TaxID=161895 RepID=A0A1L7D547_9CORY|nr:hypothetical protein [Corynebacterium phocae]APT93123.1 membrane protein [Corynebacterium phocae]KAA8722196.1 hypothetical protein F4V58_09205 [Corynebacterium phocae]
MNLLKMQPGEFRLADVTAPYRALVFPALELFLYTGLCWTGIGWIAGSLRDATLEKACIAVWLFLVVFRFVVPVWKARRRRFIITNTRVIARNGAKVDSIPLADIAGVRRHRGGLGLGIRGYQQPLYFSDLPKSKKLERVLNQQLQSFSWR